MLYEIPSINDLLDIYEDNPEWNQIQTIFNEVIDIIYNCLKEFSQYIIQDTKKDIPDYRHYLLLYLFRTKRIFESILLLLIYDRYAEAKMLQRALLENIVDTKMFLKEGRRARNIRKIKLYHLINEEIRYQLYMENDRRNQVTTVATQKMNEKLEGYINEVCKSYTEEEISNMRENVRKGLQWHGCKTKGAFKKCGMADEYEDYNLACEFVHIRDYPFPSGLLPNDDKEVFIQFEFTNTIGRITNYLKDFIPFCPNTFSNGIDNKLEEIEKKIYNLISKFSEIIDPEMMQLIGISYDAIE